LPSGGSVSEDCQYVAGDRDGLDVITVRDAGSGDEVVVQYKVSGAAGLQGSPSHLALPAGSHVTLRTTGGSDGLDFSLRSGPGALAGAEYSAPVSATGIAEIEVSDRYTHDSALIVVHILDELTRTDKPHGRLSDLGSLVTADFDGDGVEDVALGVPESDLGKPNGGAVFIFKGAASGLPAAPTWTLTGESDTANLGAVLAAGDLNGDGRAELAISEPGADITVVDSGAVLLYTWNAQGPVLLRPALTGIGASKFGAALVIADADGDGDADLLIGSPNGDLAASNTVKERGVIDVFLLDTSKAVPEFPSLRVGGVDLGADGATKSSTGLHFGRAIAAGDFNGDGRLDVASLGTVNNTLLADTAVAKNQPAIALHFGRAASPPFVAAPDLYIAPTLAQDSAEGTYRLLTAPAADGGKSERLLVAIDRLDAPDLTAAGGGKAAADAGGVYIYELSGYGAQDGDHPPQLGRQDAWARLYGDVAGGTAARSVTFADVDGDSKLDLVLGAPTAARPKDDKGATSPLTGKLLAYPYATLSKGAELNKPFAVRWGQREVDTLGVAVTRWAPGEHGLVAFAGRASTDLGDFTGRVDAYLGSGSIDKLTSQSAPLPGRVASQQRGAALQLAVIEGQLRALVGVPGFAGLGSRNDGDDMNAGQARLYTRGDNEPRIVHQGAGNPHMIGDLAAYGGRSIGSDVTTSDFDGDGRQDLIIAASQLATPTAKSTDYAQLDMACVTTNAQGNGGALVFLARPDGSFAAGFRTFAVADIAGCTPAGDARCKRKELARYGMAGGFDFNGDGKQDLLLTRANGLEIFAGRAPVDASLAKPTMVCDPLFSLPTLAQAVSAPAALGDLDGDGCAEVSLRYSDNNRSGVLILFGFAASGGGCSGHNQAAWLRLSGDPEVGLTNMQLGIAAARAGKVFNDARDCVAISAGSFPLFDGVRQPTVLLFDARELAAKRPTSGEVVISALDMSLHSWPLVYRDRAPGFGRALAGNVDLDGDGVVDLAVSAPGASINGDGTGAVFVFRGANEFGGKMDPWLSMVGDASERANVGADLSIIASSDTTPAALAIGAPLSYRTGTSNGTAWLLAIE
jgi:hypothetical protein